jgi:hypothetical protein
MPQRGFEIIPTHPLRNQARGTKVTETATGLTVEFMESLDKGEAIRQFNKHFGRI